MNDLVWVNQRIDRLLHDAEHAQSGASMAAQMGDHKYAREAVKRRDAHLSEARRLYAANTGATWPDEEDCEWRP